VTPFSRIHDVRDFSFITPLLHQRSESVYQANFNANWISLDVVVVEVNNPAAPVADPVESNISVLSGVTGTAKFGRLRTLKNSARNCTLKLSEIFLTGVFLNIEKSRFDVPGPISMLRPALPRRLKHWSEPAGKGPPTVGGAGSQFAAQKAGVGAVGTAKH
jgi:hypothetical protein